jgi:Spy/CpxP family protein refolding chaperone
MKKKVLIPLLVAAFVVVGVFTFKNYSAYAAEGVTGAPSVTSFVRGMMGGRGGRGMMNGNTEFGSTDFGGRGGFGGRGMMGNLDLTEDQIDQVEDLREQMFDLRETFYEENEDVRDALVTAIDAADKNAILANYDKFIVLHDAQYEKMSVLRDQLHEITGVEVPEDRGDYFKTEADELITALRAETDETKIKDIAQDLENLFGYGRRGQGFGGRGGCHGGARFNQNTASDDI